MKKQMSRIVSLFLVFVMLLSVIVCIPITTSAATYRSGANGASASYQTSKYYQHYANLPVSGDNVTDVLAMALSQLGYLEGNSTSYLAGTTSGTGNFTEYNYNLGSLGSYGYYWCASFMSWCLYQGRATNHSTTSTWCRNQSGNSAYVWREASCGYWVANLKSGGYFNKSAAYGGSYVPVSGDLIFFDWDRDGKWADHIGMVVYTSGGYVYTVEGNTSNASGLVSNGDGVYFKKYALSNANILGYGHLPYASTNASAKVDYTGANPTPGLYMTLSKAVTIYADGTLTTAIGTIPKFTMFTVSAGGNAAALYTTYNGVTGYVANAGQPDVSRNVIQLTNSTGTGAGSGGDSGSSGGGTTTPPSTDVVEQNVDAYTIDGTDVSANTSATISVASGQKVGLRGWIGYAQPIYRFGYAIDFNGDASTIVWPDGAASTPEDAVLTLGGSHALRYNIQADTSGLADGTHTITFYAQLQDWSIQGVGTSLTISTSGASSGTTIVTTLINSAVNGCTIDGTAASAPLSITAGQTVSLHGWVGYNIPINRFGYAIDYNGDISTVVWPSDAAQITGSDVTDVGGEYAQRYNIKAATTGLSAGTHTITFYVELMDWSYGDLGTLTVTVGSSGGGTTTTPTTPTLVHKNIDTFTTSVDNGATVYDQGADRTYINDFDATTTVIGVRGWMGFSHEITAFGYYFDNNLNTAVYSADFTASFSSTEEQNTITTLAGTYAKRFNIQAPMASLTAGNHTVHYVAKLSDGTVYPFASLSLGNVQVGSSTPQINFVDQCIDAFTTSTDNGVTVYDQPNTSTEFNEFNVATTIIGVRGWIGFTGEITSFGYYFDNNVSTAVYNDAFFSTFVSSADQTTITGVAGTYARRFNIKAPMSSLSAGTHTVHYVAKLFDGTIYTIATLDLKNLKVESTGGDSGETTVTPGEPTYNLDFSQYTLTPTASFGLTSNNVTVGANTASGYLTFTATGVDPYVGIAAPNAPSMSIMDYVVVKYRTSASASFQIYCGSGWANSVTNSWDSPYRAYTSEWKIALVDASAIWGNKNEQMANLRFDIMSDGGVDSTNYNGYSVDVSYIKFFATSEDAVSFIGKEETSSTTTTTGTLQTWPSSNVLQTGASTYTYYQTITGLNNLVATSPYAGNGDAQHCFDGWIGKISSGAYTIVPSAEFLAWEQVGLGNVHGGYWNSIGFYGWINPSACDSGESITSNSAIVDVGYQINGSSVVWIGANTKVDDRTGTGATTTAVQEDPELIATTGLTNARRYMIWIPVNQFDNTRNNQLFLYAKLSDGRVLYLNTGIYLAASPYGNNTSKGLYVSTNHAKFANYIYKDANGNYYSSKPSGYVKSYTGYEYVTGGNSFAVTKNADGTFTTGTSGVTLTTYAVNQPVAPDVPTLDGTAVTIGDMLTLRIYATIPNLAAGDWGVQCTMNGITTWIPLSSATASDTPGQYIFRFSNIAPQTMNDTLSFALVTYNATTQNISATYDARMGYSIKSSLVELMNNNSGNATLVQLVEDLLTYGAAAQIYTGYNANALVTSGLDLTPSTALPTGDGGYSYTASTGSAYIVGANIFFDQGHNKMVFAYTPANMQNVTITVNGTVLSATQDPDNDALYIAYSSPLSILDNDQTFTIKLYEGGVGGTCVQTMVYSVNAYAYRNYNKALSEGSVDSAGTQLALALYRYGLSAEAYAAA